MLIHTVLFWLNKDLSSNELEHFKAALDSLKDIPSAAAVYGLALIDSCTSRH